MKRSVILVAMIIISAIIAAQTVPRSMVIMEVATATWTQYAPGAAMGADDLLANGKKVAVIGNHNGDVYANVYSNARNTLYGITGYPTATFDGNQAVVGGSHTSSMYSSYLPKYEAAIAITSPVKIEMTETHTGLAYTVTCIITKVDPVPATLVKLNFAVTQSNIIVNWQGQTHLEHVNRLMVPDQNGTQIDFTSGPVQTVVLSFSMDPAWPLADCELIAWLQNMDAGQGNCPGGTVKKWTTFQGIKRGVIDLTPDFTVASTTINPGIPVAFTNTTYGGYIGTPETYEWHFPGATPDTSSAKNPVVVYSNCGVYDVTLVVSRGGQTDTITKVAYIYVSGGCPQHFTPVWTGNPLYPMSIAVTQATLDGTNLNAGDEIGIYDGSICVGSYTLTAPINPSSPPFITASKDDPGTTVIDGYTDGHPIVYKFWKSSASLEAGNVSHTFPYTPLYAFENFTQNETAVVALSGVTTITQNTPMIAGWNMISFNTQPSNMNLLSILQPLVTSGNLIKVIDEAGSIIQNFPWGWVNNIGNMAITEGYYIKVASNCTTSVSGSPAPLSPTIPLIAGWNMMGFPGQNPQNALTALQPLITAGTLVKVIDEAGNIIQNFPWGWVNNIGNLKAGEGYYIKVSAPCSLILNTSKKDAVEEKVPGKLTSHFNLPVNGNPYHPMALGIMAEDTVFNSMRDGDEIGVFDGELCVGAMIIDRQQTDNHVLTAFSDDPCTWEKDGFMQGNRITFRFWDKDKNRETEFETSYISGDKEFTELGTYIGEMKSAPAGSGSEEGMTWLGNNYPNPFAETTTIEYHLANQAWVTMSLFSSLGKMVAQPVNSNQEPGLYKLNLDVQKLPLGVYYYQLKTGTKGESFIQTKKMIISK